MQKNKLCLSFACLVVVALVGCTQPPPKANQLVLDVQPNDPGSKFTFTDSIADWDTGAGDGKLGYGDHFLVMSGLYKLGTAEKIGGWVCQGAKLAVSVEDGPPGQPMKITGPVFGNNYGHVEVTLVLDGRGTIHYTGLEPGFDGKGNADLSIIGGTGEFAHITGTVRQTMALSQTLSPAFAAPNGPGLPAVDAMSRRITLDYLTPAQQ